MSRTKDVLNKLNEVDRGKLHPGWQKFKREVGMVIVQALDKLADEKTDLPPVPVDVVTNMMKNFK